MPKKLGSDISLVDVVIKISNPYTGSTASVETKEISGLTMGKYYLITTASTGVDTAHTFTGCDVIWQHYSYGSSMAGISLRIALVKATSETIVPKGCNTWMIIDFTAKPDELKLAKDY